MHMQICYLATIFHIEVVQHSLVICAIDCSSFVKGGAKIGRVLLALLYNSYIGLNCVCVVVWVCWTPPFLPSASRPNLYGARACREGDVMGVQIVVQQKHRCIQVLAHINPVWYMLRSSLELAASFTKKDFQFSRSVSTREASCYYRKGSQVDCEWDGHQIGRLLWGWVAENALHCIKSVSDTGRVNSPWHCIINVPVRLLLKQMVLTAFIYKNVWLLWNKCGGTIQENIQSIYK